MTAATFVLTDGSRVQIAYPDPVGSSNLPIAVIDNLTGNSFDVQSMDATPVLIARFERNEVRYWHSELAGITRI